jgi:hypothetical protein
MCSILVTGAVLGVVAVVAALLGALAVIVAQLIVKVSMGG